MRFLVIDTETTGLDPATGHRIIEFAALEVIDRRATGRNLHLQFDPEREIDAGASAVHGKTWDDLKGQPRFAERAAEIAEFVRGAEWVIHNAPFDTSFLDAEFERAGQPPCRELAGRIIDTLALARETWPGKRNNLDALCERLGVDNTRRTLHGALLDAELLSEAYLAMTRGQNAFAMDLPAGPGAEARKAGTLSDGPRAPVLVLAPTPEEEAAHRAYLADLDAATKGRCVWLLREREATPG